MPDFSPPDYVFNGRLSEGHASEKDGSGELDWDRTDSILVHAEHVPRGWADAPLAKLIRQRVELGIDANIHDATYWLREFECPDAIDGKITSSQNAEITLVLAALFGEDRAKLPTSLTRISALFTSRPVAEAYQHVISGESTSPEEFASKIQAGELGSESPTTHSMLITAIANCRNFGLTVHKEQQAETLHALGEMSELRKRHNHDAQSWLRNHGTTPRAKLVRAWRSRNDALRNGAADNPTAIITWERTVGVEEMYSEMQQEGTLPQGLTREDLAEHKDFTWELSRVYEGRLVINALGDFLWRKSSESLFPAVKTELSDGSLVEVLAKDDPRIFTVGEDTGCCMTPTGEAHACVEAAYQDPRVSLLVMYDADGDIAAHSVMFTNPDKDPSTIILDNIETNEGRDRDAIAKLFQEFFSEYLKDDAMTSFDTVHLGIHSLERYELPLKAVSPIKSPIDYSDAREQALLYTNNPAFGTRFTPMSSTFIISYFLMEKAAYGVNAEGTLPERFIVESRTNPESHSYVISADNGEPVGYVLAYETDISTAIEEGDDKEEVIYIEDLAILPGHQAKGYGEEAMRGFLKLAQRKHKPLLFHARSTTSWQIIQSKQKELQDMGFVLDVLSEIPDYFEDGSVAHVVKISHQDQPTSIISSSLV